MKTSKVLFSLLFILFVMNSFLYGQFKRDSLYAYPRYDGVNNTIIVGAGIYFIKLQTTQFSETKKIIK